VLLALTNENLTRLERFKDKTAIENFLIRDTAYLEASQDYPNYY